MSETVGVQDVKLTIFVELGPRTAKAKAIANRSELLFLLLALHLSLTHHFKVWVDDEAPSHRRGARKRTVDEASQPTDVDDEERVHVNKPQKRQKATPEHCDEAHENLTREVNEPASM